jgi:adenylate kinase family enzyme
LTTECLTTKLGEDQFQRGIILDGYPRNDSHLVILQDILRQLDRRLACCVYLKVSKERLLSRIRSRVFCGACNNVCSMDPAKQVPDASCPSCGKAGQLSRRSDDDETVFERRYSVFERETLPLVSTLEQQKLLLTVECDGMDTPAQVFAALSAQLSHFLDQTASGLDTAYSRLERYISRNPVSSVDSETIKSFLLSWRDAALKENLYQRSGIMRRFIFLKTTNLRKFKEHCRIFNSFYGIEVIRIPPTFPEEWLLPLLSLREKLLVPLAVVREESNLYKDRSNDFSSLRQGVKAVNRATLNAWSLSAASTIQHRSYVHETAGTVDYSRRQGFRVDGSHSEDPRVFGWDDLFVVGSNQMTYHELAEFGIKHSSRDFVVSQFIKDLIHYKDLMNLRFDRQDVKRPVDFSLDLATFIDKVPFYNHPEVKQFKNLLTAVINEGMFVRAAGNRRELNYWFPALNGGIPLTAKADQIHEVTFMSHDFGHFSLPDLIYTGNDSIYHRRAYIGWRMLSESTTMALADMMLVDGLRKAGVEYDWTKRRIWPLFRDMKLDSSNMEHLKLAIKANYKYCLLGDDSLFKQTFKDAGSTEESLTSFKEKFAPFFVSDFMWTGSSTPQFLPPPPPSSDC